MLSLPEVALESDAFGDLLHGQRSFAGSPLSRGNHSLLLCDLVWHSRTISILNGNETLKLNLLRRHAGTMKTGNLEKAP